MQMAAALKSTSPSALNLNLWPKQTLAFQSPATEILYGGAAGGGKSHLMRVMLIVYCASIPGLQCYLFRRLYDDLIKNHLEGPKGFRNILAPWIDAGLVRIVDSTTVRFWNGSTIYLCHCKDERSVYKYQGAEIHFLVIDEITHFTEFMYRFLRNRVRMVGITLPREFEGKLPRILLGGNPGNLGHLWVKATFIDGTEPLSLRQMGDSEGGMVRQFIPAILEDNPAILKDDPTYEMRLRGLGSEALVRAMRFGDWNVVEGAFFDGWHAGLIIPTFTPPPTWARFRSVDWGYAKPFSVGWYAVVTDDVAFADAIPGYRGNRVFHRGALVRYKEWYGIRTDPVTGMHVANVGLRMEADDVGVGIIRRSVSDVVVGRTYEARDELRGEDAISYTVIDPSMANKQGMGPSYIERMGIHGWRKADNDRFTKPHAKGQLKGWDMMRARLRGDGIEPDLYFTENCIHAIRTIPVLQHDSLSPEDLDTEGEDHAADEVRYACMSRPYEMRLPVEEVQKDELKFWMQDGVMHANMGVMDIVKARLAKKGKRL